MSLRVKEILKFGIKLHYRQQELNFCIRDCHAAVVTHSGLFVIPACSSLQRDAADTVSELSWIRPRRCPTIALERTIARLCSIGTLDEQGERVKFYIFRHPARPGGANSPPARWAWMESGEENTNKHYAVPT